MHCQVAALAVGNTELRVPPTPGLSRVFPEIVQVCGAGFSQTGKASGCMRAGWGLEVFSHLGKLEVPEEKTELWIQGASEGAVAGGRGWHWEEMMRGNFAERSSCLRP